MSLASHERGRVARNASALFGVGALFSAILGVSYFIGAKSQEHDAATQQRYKARHAAEQMAYQQQLDAQTPKTYLSHGKRLVPKAAFIVHYPQLTEVPAGPGAREQQRTANRLLGGSGAAAIAATGAALLARRQRRTHETAVAMAADTGILYYSPRPAPVSPEEIPDTTPQPTLYGTPVRPPLHERRAAQLEAARTSYDPYANALNHAAASLLLYETVTSAVA